MDALSFLQTWAVVQPPLVLTQDGGISLAPMSKTSLQERIQADLERISGVLVPPPVGVGRAPALTEQVRIHPPNAERFTFALNNLLSTTDRSGRPIEKFSWNPLSGEILFIHPPMQH